MAPLILATTLWGTCCYHHDFMNRQTEPWLPRWFSGKESLCQCRVRSLGQEYPLEEEMATHSSILAWRIPWTEEPGGLQSMGLKEWDMTEHAHTFWIVVGGVSGRINSAKYCLWKRPLLGLLNSPLNPCGWKPEDCIFQTPCLAEVHGRQW